MPLDPGDQTALVLPADGVRAPTRTHRRIKLPAGIYAPVTACDANVNPSGTIVNPLLDLLFNTVSSRRTRVSPAWGENRQETRPHVDALETGADGKTDSVTLKEARPGHQDGERFLTVSQHVFQLRHGAKIKNLSARMSYGLMILLCPKLQPGD